MTLIEQLGIQNLVLTPTGFTAQMPLGDFHAQPQGFLNGGATLALLRLLLVWQVISCLTINILLSAKRSMAII